jgi:hypothetical protein
MNLSRKLNVDDIEQLFPGYRALILAGIARWREYDPAINPDIVDSFRSLWLGIVIGIAQSSSS